MQLDGLWEVHTAKLGNPDDQQNNVDAEFEAAELLFYLDPAISGTQDDDELAGNERDNVIIGFSGNDKISGGAGDDVLYGGDGIDELSGNDGSNILDGGEGYDRAKFHLGLQDHNYIDFSIDTETSIYHLSQADSEIGTAYFTDGNLHVDIELPEVRSENVISNVELLHFSWMLDEQVWAATNFEVDYYNQTIEFSTNPDWAAREIHGSLDNNVLSGSAAMSSSMVMQAMMNITLPIRVLI